MKNKAILKIKKGDCKMKTPNNITKQMVLLIALMMLSLQLSKASEIVIQEAKGKLDINSKIVVPINILPEEGEQISCLQLDVRYDPEKINLDNVLIGDSALKSEKEIEYAKIGDDTIRILLHGLNNTIMSQGTIAKLECSLTQIASAGPSPLMLLNTVASDPSAKATPIAAKDNAIVIEAPVYIDLSELKVYPNPFKPSLNHTKVTFKNLPVESRVKLYTLTGEMVIELKDPTGSEIEWDVKNEDGKEVASGTYYYSIISEDDEKETGRIVVVR